MPNIHVTVLSAETFLAILSLPLKFSPLPEINLEVFPDNCNTFFYYRISHVPWKQLIFSYNANKNQISHHLECFKHLIDKYGKNYENYIFVGDFSVNISDSSIKEFCSLNELENLISKPTCYKNSEKTTYVDLILTNQPTLFQHSTVLETGFSDFHLPTVTEFKKFPKMQAQYYCLSKLQKLRQWCF